MVPEPVDSYRVAYDYVQRNDRKHTAYDNHYRSEKFYSVEEAKAYADRVEQRAEMRADISLVALIIIQIGKKVVELRRY